jgi:hypothetical protein
MSGTKRPQWSLVPRRPSAAEASSPGDLPATADDWVRRGTEAVTPPAPEPPAQTPVESSASESTKRLTIEVPASLHHAIMVHARVTGVTAKDEITPLLRQHYADALKLYQR